MKTRLILFLISAIIILAAATIERIAGAPDTRPGKPGFPSDETTWSWTR